MKHTEPKIKKLPVAMRQRSASRIAAVQLNFQYLFVEGDLETSLTDYLKHYSSDVAKEMNVRDIDVPYFKKLVFDCKIHELLIRELISSSLAGSWNIDRLSKADLTILSVAICELKNMAKTPVKVIIAEYTAIAEAYNSDVPFINAILDKVARKLRTKEI